MGKQAPPLNCESVNWGQSLLVISKLTHPTSRVPSLSGSTAVQRYQINYSSVLNWKPFWLTLWNLTLLRLMQEPQQSTSSTPDVQPPTASQLNDSPSDALAEAGRSPVLRHCAYGHSLHFISSCRHFIASHPHKKKGEYRTIRYFERERPYSHNLYYIQGIVIIVLFY